MDMREGSSGCDSRVSEKEKASERTRGTDKGDVDELIETSRTEEGRVDLIRSVGSSDDLQARRQSKAPAAGSRTARTKTFFFAFIPSISVRIWLRTRSPAPPASPPPPPRDLAIESSSSKKSTTGALRGSMSAHETSQERTGRTQHEPCQRRRGRWPRTLRTTS